jgi:hypothetical protein
MKIARYSYLIFTGEKVQFFTNITPYFMVCSFYFCGEGSMIVANIPWLIGYCFYRCTIMSLVLVIKAHETKQSKAKQVFQSVRCKHNGNDSQ